MSEHPLTPSLIKRGKPRRSRGGGCSMRLHSKLIFKDRKRGMRNNPTLHEALLWENLKGKKLGFKFQRQHSIGPYIVDFYCAEGRLIIELDGEQHNQNVEYDIERSKFFEFYKYRVLRFWNNEITSDIHPVLMKIKKYLSDLAV